MTVTRPTLSTLIATTIALLATLVLAPPGPATAALGRAEPAPRQSPGPSGEETGVIVYIHAGDIWLSSPDGLTQQALTDVGNLSLPSVADDGTILAVQAADPDEIVQVARDGTIVSLGVPTATGGASIVDMAVSPDGDALAVVTQDLTRQTADRHLVLRVPDLAEVESVRGGGASVAWVRPLGEDLIAFGDLQNDQYGVHTLGIPAVRDPDPQTWFPTSSTSCEEVNEPSECAGLTDVRHLDVRLDHGLMAITGCDRWEQTCDATVDLLQVDGPAPLPDPPSTCTIARPALPPQHPSLSPAGTGLVVETQPSFVSDGPPPSPWLTVYDGLDAGTCSGNPGYLLATDATDPWWTPVDLFADEEPTPTPGGGGRPVTPAEEVTLSIGDVQVQEGDEGLTDVEVDLELSGPLEEDLTVTLQVTEDTATQDDSNDQFTRQLSTLQEVKVDAGQTAAQAVVSIAGDEENEPDETFTVEVTDTAPRITVADGEGTITILDDDGPDDVEANEPLGYSDSCLVPVNGLGMFKTEPMTPALIALGVNGCQPTAGVGRVLIARDDDFPDAMAAGVMQDDAPLLLVPGQGPLPADVRARLLELGPTEVVLLGGPAAVSDAVEAELLGLGFTVSRRQGATRLETAVDIATKEAGGVDTVMLARAFSDPASGDATQAFADTIAAGGLAAETGWPILLTETAALSPATRAFMQQAGVQHVHIMGGTAAVSQAVEDELTGMGLTVERAAGPTRFETALAVAGLRGEQGDSDVSQVMLVDGTSPTAWAGGFSAAHGSAQQGAPIVLADGEDLPAATAEWLAAEGATAVRGPAGLPSVRPVTCISTGEACAAAREAFGLPGATVTFDPSNGAPAVGGQAVTATVETDDEVADVRADGSCLRQPSADLDALQVRADLPNLPCLLRIVITFADGTSQAVAVAYT